MGGGCLCCLPAGHTDCSERSTSPGSLNIIPPMLTMYCLGIKCCLVNDSIAHFLEYENIIQCHAAH